MIEELKNYFSACPVLDGREVNINFLAEKSGSVSIEPAKCTPIIKSYKTGGSLRQYCFALVIRCPKRGSEAEALGNEQLCEALADWAEENSENGNLPKLAMPLASQRLEVSSGGYLEDGGSNHAKYQIVFRLIYTKI